MNEEFNIVVCYLFHIFTELAPRPIQSISYNVHGLFSMTFKVLIYFLGFVMVNQPTVQSGGVGRGWIRG